MKKVFLLAILLGSLVACEREVVNPDNGVSVDEQPFYLGKFHARTLNNEKVYHIEVTPDSFIVERIHPHIGYRTAVIYTVEGNSVIAKNKAMTGYMDELRFEDDAGEFTPDAGSYIITHPEMVTGRKCKFVRVEEFEN